MILFIVVALSIGKISCTNEDPYAIRRFRDISEALNYMYEHLPDRMTVDDKCKRYAVALAERLPYQKTVSNVMAMDKAELNKSYGKMDIDRIISVYMNAIERYRMTQLAPALIDVVECLKLINLPAVNAYLNHHELVILLDLYKQVLGLPAGEIDPKNLNPTILGRAFWASLENLFGQNLDIFSQYRQDQQVDGQKSRTNPHSSQRRERSRLISLRQRMLDPEGVRKYQNERRRSAIVRKQLMLSQAPDSPEVLQIKRRARERQNKINERQRSRRQQLRDRNHLEQLKKEIDLLISPESDDIQQHDEPQKQQAETSPKSSPETKIVAGLYQYNRSLLHDYEQRKPYTIDNKKQI